MSNFKIMLLEAKFGQAGYAYFFKTLELIARSDETQLVWDNQHAVIYARMINCSFDEYVEFINYATSEIVGALSLRQFREKTYLYSENLIKRLEPLFEKRASDAERIAAKRKTAKTGDNDANNEVVAELSQNNRGIVAEFPSRDKVKDKEKDNISITDIINYSDAEKKSINDFPKPKTLTELELGGAAAAAKIAAKMSLIKQSYPDFEKAKADWIAQNANVTEFKSMEHASNVFAKHIEQIATLAAKLNKTQPKQQPQKPPMFGSANNPNAKPQYNGAKYYPPGVEQIFREREEREKKAKAEAEALKQAQAQQEKI